MKVKTFHKITGGILILAVLAAVVGQIGIETHFAWEGHSVPEILVMYHNGGAVLNVIWLIFAAGSFLLIPSALLLHKVLYRYKNPLLYIGTAFGVIAGLAYLVGIMRWLLLANLLSDLYANPATGDATKHIVETLFQAVNVYAGNTFGETLAPIAHGIWLLFLGTEMFRSKICWRWLALAQIFGGVVIACRPLEYIGWKTIASVSDKGLMLWAITLLIFGMQLCLSRDDRDIRESDIENP